MDALHKRIARNIKARAVARGIVLTHLPDRAGVGRSSFFLFMSGKGTGKGAFRSPTVRWLAKLAGALGCDVVNLLEK